MSETDAAKQPPAGALRRALHRLTSPEHVLEAEKRQEEAAGVQAYIRKELAWKQAFKITDASS